MFEITKMVNEYQVSFTPVIKQVDEIEEWLIEEENKTGSGFYSKWDIIKSSYKKNKLAIISYRNKAVGFATWRLTTEKTAKIEILEVKLELRRNGIGRKLTSEIFNFLKDKNIFVVELDSLSENAELFWKHIGFKEFPEPPKKYNFNVNAMKKLYYVLKQHLLCNHFPEFNETIELWNTEPYNTDKNSMPTSLWNLGFVKRTRRLSKPIIYPANCEWLIRWKVNGGTMKNDKIKNFGSEIHFDNFIIIEKLNLNQNKEL